MLKKLLKYDLKNMFKFLSVFYILAIFFAVLTRIFFSLEQTTIINVIGQICIGATIAMIANIIINNIMRNWVRFKETLYGDESYLTHTLPVKKNTLYQSKFILAITTMFVSFIVIIASLSIVYLNTDNWDIIKEGINQFAGVYGLSGIGFIIIMGLILFLELFSALQAGFLGIILGNRKGNRKTVASVIFGFIVYMATQVVVLITIFVVGLCNSNVMQVFTSNNVSGEILKPIIIASFIAYTMIIVVINLICSKVLSKGVNVE